MGSYVIGRSVAEDSTDFDILSSLLLALGLLMLVLNFFADDPPKYTDFTGTAMVLREAAKKIKVIFLVVRPLRPYPPSNLVAIGTFFLSKISNKKSVFFYSGPATNRGPSPKGLATKRKNFFLKF